MNLALFDFDGTITVGDTFVPFLRFAMRTSRIALGAILATPHGLGYRLGVVPASRARPVLAKVGFRGEQAQAVRALGRQYATDVLPQCLRENALDRIRWHQQQGDLVVVVSASLDVYLAPWCETAGVDVICTELEERRGILTGRYRDGDCSGVAKSRRIRQRYDLNKFPVVYAYGDSPEDFEMLALAHRKYLRSVEIDDLAAHRGAG